MSRMQEKIDQRSTEPAFAGIDVSKNTLDLFICPDGVTMSVDNTRTGIKRLIRECEQGSVRLVALEATGKYHRLAHELLHQVGIDVPVINPFRSRQFADSLGKLAKTDTIDAQALALFVQRMRPAPTPPPEEHLKQLHDLHTARRQACDEVANLKRQLQTTDHPMAARQIRARIAMGTRHRLALEKAMQAIIMAHADLKRKFEILTSIPGLGPITASIMLADLTELGEANAKEIAALAGVAPMNWDSGIKNGNRMIRGGRRSVRNALYMCAVSCIRRPDALGKTYQNLICRGKDPKVAITAVMRKLVILANTLVAEDRKWQAERPA